MRESFPVDEFGKNILDKGNSTKAKKFRDT